MVSDFIMGAIIGGVFTLLGSLGAAVVDIYKTKNIQQNEDKRIIAQKLAEEDAELLTELNFQLNKCHRFYTEGVHRAATHTLSEEKYNKDYKQEFRKLQEIVERSSLFLNDRGEDGFFDYLKHLTIAERYMKRKVREYDNLEPREGETAELLQQDNAELDMEEWQRDYEIAKTALKNESGDRLEMLNPPEG